MSLDDAADWAQVASAIVGAAALVAVSIQLSHSAKATAFQSLQNFVAESRSLWKAVRGAAATEPFSEVEFVAAIC